ncbi:hypothetical protein AEA09_07420 [Lysinibacillus contaminans]|uniref:Lipoprotein n=1 Tax=Lysinibacillus contaminans TaxID=1293441 RepID=A0ABR5K0F9_9BACI|nr:hypothetical protein [Lysinibacillus contaminans]KOS68402.1 hypothetical protein AEA09_07420 [Lysinibacillus contaminans]
MKKILFLLIFSIFIVGAVGIIYLKSNPPLVINGYKSFDDNAKIRLIEIENKGIRELQLQNVVVNDGLPENAELVVSKAEQLETDVPNDPNITFHGIKQIKLFPSRYIDRKAVGKLPQHFGLKIEATDIQKITIHYKYLKIPFTLSVELKTVEQNT